MNFDFLCVTNGECDKPKTMYILTVLFTEQSIIKNKVCCVRVKCQPDTQVQTWQPKAHLIWTPLLFDCCLRETYNMVPLSPAGQTKKKHRAVHIVAFASSSSFTYNHYLWTSSLTKSSTSKAISQTEQTGAAASRTCSGHHCC